MLTIRKEQMSIFASLQREDFARRLFHYFKTEPHFVDLGLSDDSLRQTISARMTQAMDYAIHDERGIFKFIGLLLLLGDAAETDEYAWMWELFSETGIASDTRLSLIETRLRKLSEINDG